MREYLAIGAAALIAGLHKSPSSEWRDALASVMPPPREPNIRSVARGPLYPVKPKTLAKRHAANKAARKARRKSR